MRCVLPVGPDESYQGGFAPVVRKSAQDFLDESLLFIETEEFREFYRTSGRTDVAACTSSPFLDGHGEAASKPWRAPPISWNSTSACMRYRQHSVSSHATPLHDVNASSSAITCNMLANAMAFGGSLHHVAMQGARFLASALRSYAVLLIGAIQLRPFCTSRPVRSVRLCSLFILSYLFLTQRMLLHQCWSCR